MPQQLTLEIVSTWKDAPPAGHLTPEEIERMTQSSWERRGEEVRDYWRKRFEEQRHKKLK